MSYFLIGYNSKSNQWRGTFLFTKQWIILSELVICFKGWLLGGGGGLVTDNRRSRLDSPFCVITQNRKFEFGHHRQSRIPNYRGTALTRFLNLLYLPPFEILSSILDYSLALYGDTHRRKQYLLFWFKLYFDCFSYKIIYNNTIFHRICLS